MSARTRYELYRLYLIRAHDALTEASYAARQIAASQRDHGLELALLDAIRWLRPLAEVPEEPES